MNTTCCRAFTPSCMRNEQYRVAQCFPENCTLGLEACGPNKICSNTWCEATGNTFLTPAQYFGVVILVVFACIVLGVGLMAGIGYCIRRAWPKGEEEYQPVVELIEKKATEEKEEEEA